MNTSRKRTVAKYLDRDNNFQYYLDLYTGQTIICLKDLKKILHKTSIVETFVEDNSVYGRVVNSRNQKELGHLKRSLEWISFLNSIKNPEQRNEVYTKKIPEMVIEDRLEEEALHGLDESISTKLRRFLKMPKENFPITKDLVIVPKDTTKADEIFMEIVSRFPLPIKYIAPNTLQVKIENEGMLEKLRLYMSDLYRLLTPQSTVVVRSTVDAGEP